MSKKKEVAAMMVSNQGEVTNEIYYGDKVKITRAETLKFLEETVEIGKEELFVKYFKSTMADIRNENLTGNQWKLLTLIIEYFRYDSGLVSYDNGNPLTVEDMSKLADMPVRTVFDAMEKLVAKRIVGKWKVGYEIKYYVNPFIFCKGMRVNKTLYTMFENSKWRAFHKK